jgi:hypothetical protein
VRVEDCLDVMQSTLERSMFDATIGGVRPALAATAIDVPNPSGPKSNSWLPNVVASKPSVVIDARFLDSVQDLTNAVVRARDMSTQ